MKRTLAMLGAAAVSIVLVGCSAEVPTTTDNVVAGYDILTSDLASVILVAGDIEKAVADGTVTPAEVAEARASIEDGTLDLWRQRAETE
jgi:hypothetical protein